MNNLYGKYLDWENCGSFENSNLWTWITTFSNSVECFIDRNMLCVNLIVLQKHNFTFVNHTKRHVCTITRNLSFSQPSAYLLENLWRTPGVRVIKVMNLMCRIRAQSSTSTQLQGELKPFTIAPTVSRVSPDLPLSFIEPSRRIIGKRFLQVRKTRNV